MGYVPGYKNDVFISYAHVDNDPVVAGKPGWVDFFEDLLRKRVKVRLRGEIQFFRDQQLRLYGKFSDQLAKELAASAVLICVPSPNYVESDWCLWELGQFCKQTGSDRVFKAVKTYFDEQSLKPEAQALLKQFERVLDCRFYSRNDDAMLVEDLQPEIIPDHIPAYLQKIDVIAQNLAELLKKLSHSPAPTPHSSTPTVTVQSVERPAARPDSPQIAIYLAEPTREKELEAAYNSIKSELTQFNYRVLPDQPLPLDAEELAITVRRHLQEARIFVHLLGAKYGVRPDGDARSLPHLQYDLAAELDRQRQIVWLPTDVKPDNETQEDFIARVKSNSPDYRQCKLEDLKTAIWRKLQPEAENPWEENGKDDIKVCLFRHQQDQAAAAPLYSHLILQEEFKVQILSGEPQSLQKQKQTLQTSDAVLLYYGVDDQDWFVNNWRLIQRHISVGRTKPVLAKAIFAGNPLTDEKNMLVADDPLIIKHYDTFRPSVIAPFVERIRAAKGGAR